MLSVSVAAAACVTSSAVRPSTAQPLHVLTAAELSLTGARDALRAIETARPSWLAPGGGPLAAADRVQVYIEGTRYNDVSDLQRVSVAAIREIQYLEGREATARYGSGHSGGAIVVRLIRG